jgi:putative transcriptional regulator
LTGSFFARAVILICQHDAEGAFGLVLNRPTGNKVGDALVADLPDSVKELPLYLGGPVQPTAMSFLHADNFLPEANVLANLSLGHSLDGLMDLGDSFSATKKVKLFAGYSGWAPGQLENEMRRKAWLTHPASLDLIFAADPGSLWPSLMRQKGWANQLLAQIPDDPSLN